MEAKLGNNPLLLRAKTELLSNLLLLRRVLGVDHSKVNGFPLKVIRFLLPTLFNKFFRTWPLLDGAPSKYLM